MQMSDDVEARFAVWDDNDNDNDNDYDYDYDYDNDQLSSQSSIHSGLTSSEGPSAWALAPSRLVRISQQAKNMCEWCSCAGPRHLE